jgi:hypothetical protein
VQCSATSPHQVVIDIPVSAPGLEVRVESIAAHPGYSVAAIVRLRRVTIRQTLSRES